ncbi:glycerophosphodiester phosphodiesterase [Cellulomonas sp. zg-ZUI40]|nr:glycerophosphodiester phosphodiesterase [Cellulomonas dongxiuzhuiae]
MTGRRRLGENPAVAVVPAARAGQSGDVHTDDDVDDSRGHAPSRASHPYFDDPSGVVALAHRGFALDGRENSLTAFGAAVDLGFRYVETDAHATSDDVAVALHDETLDRTTDAEGLVSELPWSVVGRALIGGVDPVPRLEDVLGTWPGLRVNIDVKSEHAIVPVAHAIERTASHDRVCVTSFSVSRRRATLAHLSRPVATSAASGEVARFLASHRARAGRLAARALRDVDALQVPVAQGRLRVVDAGTLAAAHVAGRHVHVWTVNDPVEMHRLLDLGVDGLVTDRADLLRDVLRSRGLWT